MATRIQEHEHAAATDILDRSLEWIGENMEPDTVFEWAKLRDWTEACTPDALFSLEQLEQWALACGFVKVEPADA